jgi:two-component system sensor histidine kinase KdpD
VRVEAATSEDRVEIRVVDEGPGIPPGRHDEVFQPFQRLGDRAGGAPNGLGLGLAVARGFIEAVGGTLTVEDTPGAGATFVFTLRRAQP